MMNPLLARFADVPSLIEPGFAARFEADLGAVMRDENSGKLLSTHASAGDDFWFPADDWRSAYRPYVVRDGILLIPVKGVLLSDFPWAFGSWATGYLYITRALERGLEDGNVRGIALLGNSYGGEGQGCFEASNKIFGLRGRKPIRSFIEIAYSAGYAVCSAADTMTGSTTSGSGSIGVVMTHLDVSRAMENAGMKITFVHFGKHKVDGNRYEPLPADVQARWQGWCDEQGLQFCNLVARNRDMDVRDVKATEADCYMSSEALKLGLIDAIAPQDDALAIFNTELSAMDDNEEEIGMTTQTQANKDGNNGAPSTASLESARTEGHAAGKLEGSREGATAERARISSILSSEEAKGRTSLAHHLAFETDMTAAAANTMLGKAAKEADDASGGDALSTRMDRLPNPQVGADGDTDNSDAAQVAKLAGSIVQSYLGKPAAH